MGKGKERNYLKIRCKSREDYYKVITKRRFIKKKIMEKI